MKSCEKLVTKQFRISWMDRFADRRSQGEPLSGPGGAIALNNIGDKIVEDTGDHSNRIKYSHQCRQAGKAINVWGKPSLNINCGDCGLGYEPVTQ